MQFVYTCVAGCCLGDLCLLAQGQTLLFRYLAVMFAAGAVAMTAIAVLLSVRVGQVRDPPGADHAGPAEQGCRRACSLSDPASLPLLLCSTCMWQLAPGRGGRRDERGRRCCAETEQCKSRMPHVYARTSMRGREHAPLESSSSATGVCGGGRCARRCAAWRSCARSRSCPACWPCRPCC